MKLTILGASGGCGGWLEELAVGSGHPVTTLVRPSAAYTETPEVRVLRGEVLEADTVAAAVEGCDAVLCALGQRRAGDSPWARPLSPPDLMGRVARILVEVLPRVGVSRLVVVSAAGVRESMAQLSRPVRWLVRQGQIGVAYRDLADMESVLEASPLDWLAVRPVTLVDGPATFKGAPVERYGFFSTVRRADVAAWMLDAATQPRAFQERTVLLGTPGRRERLALRQRFPIPGEPGWRPQDRPRPQK